MGVRESIELHCIIHIISFITQLFSKGDDTLGTKAAPLILHI